MSERVLWHEIRSRKIGYRFNRQVPVGPYVLDFYCAEAGLCLEVDGEQHADRAGPDAASDRYLQQRGIETIRVPSLELFEEKGYEMARHLANVWEVCEQRVKLRRGEDQVGQGDQSLASLGMPHPQPPPQFAAQTEEGA